MPKVKLVPVIEEIHGTMYDLVFKKLVQGKDDHYQKAGHVKSQVE